MVFDFDQTNHIYIFFLVKNQFIYMLHLKQRSSHWIHLLLLVCIVVLAYISLFGVSANSVHRHKLFLLFSDRNLTPSNKHLFLFFHNIHRIQGVTHLSDFF